jgi:hypothetical protein
MLPRWSGRAPASSPAPPSLPGAWRNWFLYGLLGKYLYCGVPDFDNASLSSTGGNIEQVTAIVMEMFEVG